MTLSGYQILGTLSRTAHCHTQIALPRGGQRQVIINEAPISPDMLPVFREYYNFWASHGGASEILAMFSENKRFFMVFPYVKQVSLRDVFQRQPDAFLLNQRFNIMRELLLGLFKVWALPLSARRCITRPEHICVDEQGAVSFLYELDDLSPSAPDMEQDIYVNMARCMQLLFHKELAASSGVALRIVHDKAKNGIFVSIPAFLKALEEAEEHAENRDWKYRAAEIVHRHQKLIQRAQVLVGASACVLVIVYLLSSLLTMGARPAAASKLNAIGSVIYLSDDAIDHEIEPVLPVSASGDTQIMVTLGEPPILYEDYIVRSGDTLDSVCQAYYGDARYCGAVAQFNQLPAEQTALAAGTILKLPDRGSLTVTVLEDGDAAEQ